MAIVNVGQEWERTGKKVGAMDVYRIPVHSGYEDGVTDDEGKKVKKVVGYYECPIPDDIEQTESFIEWAVSDAFGEGGPEDALNAFVSGVQVKLAGPIRNADRIDPAARRKRAAESIARLDPEAKRALLAELQAELG